MPNKTFNLYLGRQGFTDFESFLSESATSRLKVTGTQVLDKKDFGEGARLYVFQNVENTPRWYYGLADTFKAALVRSRSACALLLFRQSGRMFATTFGHGWLFLDGEKFESDFGLRAAINALDDKKLKRLDRSNLGDALKGVTLSSFRRGLETFGVNEALDLIRKIGGSTKDNAPGETITGSKSLAVTGEFSLEDLPELANDALELLKSIEYRKTPFKVIDVVSPVLNAAEISDLDQLAAKSIRERGGDFELGLPSEYLDEEVAFKFRGLNLRGSFPNLTIQNYQDALGSDLDALNVDRLRKDHVVAVFEADDRPNRAWTIRSALVGSISYRRGRYAINDGEWYRLDEAFKEMIDKSFDDIQKGWEKPPMPLRTIIDGDGSNRRYQTERSYNEETAKRLGFVLLDGALIQIPEIQRSEFEVCDLLDIDGKRLIHIKKSSRRSNVLSHFFKQGANSALQLKSFPTAWEETIKLVQKIGGRKVATSLREALQDRERPWTVEFQIADTPRRDGTFRIPFFSRITLRDEALRMRAMEYNVVLKFIPQEAPSIPKKAA